MKFIIQTVARLFVAVLLIISALTEGVWCAAQGQATGQTADVQPVRAAQRRHGNGLKLRMKRSPRKSLWRGIR